MLAALPQCYGFNGEGRKGRKAAKDAGCQKQAGILPAQM